MWYFFWKNFYERKYLYKYIIKLNNEILLLKLKTMSSIIPGIEIPISSLHIRKTEQQKEYISIKGDFAFNDKIIDICREAGVQNEYIHPEDN